VFFYSFSKVSIYTEIFLLVRGIVADMMDGLCVRGVSRGAGSLILWRQKYEMSMMF
jgi:hypothetical protein